MTTYSINLRFSLPLSLPLSLSLSLSLLLFLFSTGCQHGDENPDTASYRIIEMKFYEGDVLTAGAYYSYEGERLSQITSYSDDFQDTARNVFEYPDENSVVWSELTPLVKIECSYQDGKMTQFQRSQFTSNSWEILEKYIYHYTGGNLTEENLEGTIYEQYRPFEKFLYEYNDNKVAQSICYYYNQFDSSWIELEKEEALYTGDKITKVIRYSYQDSAYVEYYHADLQYDGSLLTSALIYASATNELMVSYIYSYDDHGNMITRESTDGPAGDRIECFYEAGKGNLQEIQKPGGGINFYMGFPMPN